MAKKLTPEALADKIIELNSAILVHEAPLKELKLERDELREQMLEALQKSRLNEVRTEGGVTFTRAFRNSYKVIDSKKALPWLLKNDAVKPDTIKLGKLLRGVPAIPDGIEWTETPYLSVRGLNSEEE